MRILNRPGFEQGKSRTKVVLAVAALVTAVTGVASALGLELGISEQELDTIFKFLVLLAGLFLRDAVKQ